MLFVEWNLSAGFFSDVDSFFYLLDYGGSLLLLLIDKLLCLLYQWEVKN
jgi:hypothetical protein